MRNPCKICFFYNEKNNTCQSKKVSGIGDGHVSLLDKLFCEPFRPEEDEVTDEQTN